VAKTAPYPPGDGFSGIPYGHNPGYRATLRRDNTYETYRRAVTTYFYADSTINGNHL